MSGSTIRIVPKLILLLLMLITGRMLQAQGVSRMHVKDNIIYLTLNRNLATGELDSFTYRYNLKDIGLYQLILSGKDDSLIKRGWKLDKSNPQAYLITKPLARPDKFQNPAEKIIFSSIPTPDNWRVQGGNRVVYGINQFKNNLLFERKDDVVVFSLKGYQKAREVRLAGSFTNWQHAAFPMTKTENGWVALVKLTDGPHYYKFIIDGHHWITDPNNEINENDGKGNINSVYFVTNKVFRLPGYPYARDVFLAGSFNNWMKDQLRMQKSNDGWQLVMYLEPGTHRYQFLVDGKPAIVEKDISKDTRTAIGDAYVFKLIGFTKARKVALAGNFNDWAPEELWMERTAEGWQLPYVLGPGNYQYKFIVDGQWITDPANTGVIDDDKGNQNSFLVIKANYHFRLQGYESARNVYVAGDFNDWGEKVSPMKKINGEWGTDVYLGRGKHRYKFIVDGKWILDPGNKLWEDNEYGTGNSVLWIE